MAKKQSKPDSASAGLLAALKFINIAQRTIGPPHTQHCVLFDGMAYGSDGILSAGHKIEEHLQAAPHTAGLIAALSRCQDRMSIAELPSGLSVRSERFRAIIPCHDLSAMPALCADPPIAPLDDEQLRAALAAVGPLATEGAPKVIQAAVRLSAGLAVATNGFMLVEYWHGMDLPTILLPKASVKAIESVKKKFTHFGCSASSATFYYEDGSWIKTQLFVETYPDTGKVLDVKSSQWPIPQGFFDGLRSLLPFVDDGRAVFLSKGRIHTHPNSELKGGSYEVPGVPDDRCFNIDCLLLLEPFATSIDFGSAKGNLTFFGKRARGALAPRFDAREEPKPTTPPTIHYAKQFRTLSAQELKDMDDDIPF